MKKEITIVTHDGRFHADDVFAVAAFQLAFLDEKISIVRTRDVEWFKNGDYIVDVGGVYEPDNNKFDHHQIGGVGKRVNGIPYAGFGLMWKKFGKQICGSDEIAFSVDEKLVQCVDAGDNGVDISKPIFRGVRAYTIGEIINSYVPRWKETDKNTDEEFIKAVNWARTLLEREIEIVRYQLEAEKIIDEYYKKAEDKRLIVFNDKNHSFGREVVTSKLLQHPEPLYAVFYRSDVGNWQIIAINKDLNTYETRKPFPESWRGLTKKELAVASGVPDALFCHRNGFMCVAESKEGAIKLAQMALGD